MLTDPLLRGAIDERMIAAMRLMLVLLALLSTYIDPAETTHYEAATYTVLACYLAYSLILVTLAVRRRSPIPATVAYWADVGWDILLIGSSKGTNSIFFFFLFFAILVAAFQAGFAAGMRVTLVATVLFTGIGFAMAPAEPEFERIFTGATFLYLLVNKRVRCDFEDDPSGYKSLIAGKSST